MRKLRSPGARKSCISCGKDLRAKYPYYIIRKKENAWKSPKIIGRICEDCMKKIHAYARNGEPR